MKLLVDIGNSRIKGALETEAGLQLLPILSCQASGLPEALAAWDEVRDIESCWVASVGHAGLCDQLESWSLSKFAVQPQFPKSTALICGVTNAYAVPGNLGVDRWLAMIAVHSQISTPTVVVSAGTAVTIDAIDETGQHLGGLIAPGITTQRKAMLDHTQVRADTSQDYSELLGNSTDACVSLGTTQAILGYIERVTRQLQQTHDNWRCVIGGGDAEVLLPHLGSEWEHQPLLVLTGLAVMAENYN